MASLAPDLSSLSLARAHGGELATLALLKRTLPSDYTVFHGVHWTREWRNRPVFGEADFVIVNRSGDVLVIEQKNGGLEEESGRLFKAYGDGRKNVGEQLHRTLDALRDKFGLHNARGGLILDYLIYCPDHRLTSLNAAGLDTSRIVDARQAGELPGVIAALIGPGHDSQAGERVRRFFEHTCELAPDIHAHVAAGERTMVRLCGGLVSTVAAIEMQPLRLRVRGTAGCGKSAVAARAFTAAVEAGRRPLMLCFNRALAERLKAGVGPGGMVNTWFGFLDRFLASKGIALDFERMRTEPGFWAEVMDRALVESVPEDWRFDLLIVDEGQDFAPDWAEMLQLFLAPGGDVLWLEDPEQNLTGQAAARLDDFVGYRTRANHRSPESIARFIQRTLPFAFEIANDLPGLGVGVTAYAESEQQSAQVARIVTELVRRGFRHGDIAVLSLKGVERATLARAERVGPFTLKRFTGAYDLLGNQVSTPGQVLFDTARRFKGQQAPAVILTDVDPSADPERSDAALRLMFCAMTRATLRLALLVRRGGLLTERFLEAA